MAALAARPPSLARTTLTAAEDAGRPDLLDARIDAHAAVALEDAPDLRFKWVGATRSMMLGQGYGSTADGLGQEISNVYEGSFGVTPLGIWDSTRASTPDAGAPSTPPTDGGSGSARRASGVWFYDFRPVPPVESMRYALSTGGRWSFDEHERGWFEKGMIMISLDFVGGGYHAAWIGELDDPLRYPGMNTISLPRHDLAEWVALQGANGRVVTAVSGDGDDDRTLAFAFARRDDTRTFETMVLEPTRDNLVESARTLADQGYLITAFGQAGPVYLVVGTRPRGEVAPRELRVEPSSLSAMAQKRPIEIRDGYAIVAWLFESPERDGIILLQR